MTCCVFLDLLVNVHIQSECTKVRTKKSSIMHTSCAVILHHKRFPRNFPIFLKQLIQGHMRIFLLARPKTANEIIDIKFLILKEIKMVFRT